MKRINKQTLKPSHNNHISNNTTCYLNEITKASDIVANKNNVLLIGEPCIDKAQFFQQVWSQLPKYTFGIYVDLFNISDELDFIQVIYQAIVDQLPLKNNIQNFSHYFPILDLKLTAKNQQNFCSVKELIAHYKFDDLLEQIFVGVTLFCNEQNYSHAIIAIDNFQKITQIKNLKIDAKLRAISQVNKQVCFIFSGETSPLQQLFTSYQQPLYGTTTPIVLKRL